MLSLKKKILKERIVQKQRKPRQSGVSIDQIAQSVEHYVLDNRAGGCWFKTFFCSGMSEINQRTRPKPFLGNKNCVER